MTSPDFTYEDAVRLVKLTYRTDPEKLPLRGKESELLEALNIAKQHHDALLEQHQTYYDLQAGFDNVKRFASHGGKMYREWQELSRAEKEWMANLAFQAEVLDGYRAGANPEAEQSARLVQMEGLIGQLGSLNQMVDDLEKRPHRPEELVALKAFIDELKTFWKSEACDEKFYIQHSGAEKMSSASKLVLAAAQALGQGYTLTNCDSALRPRLSKKSDKHRAIKVNKKRVLNRGWHLGVRIRPPLFANFGDEACSLDPEDCNSYRIKLMTTLIYSVRDVLKLVPISKTTMHDLINDGLFPKPIQIGKQKTGYLKSEIDAWIEQRIKDA